MLGLTGFIAGVGLLMLGGFRTADSGEFVRSAGFAPWAATIGAQTAFWLIVAGHLWVRLVQVWRESELGRSAIIALAGALVLVLVVFPQFSLARTLEWPLWGHQWKMRALTITGGLLVGVPALSGIALVHERVRHREAGPVGDEDVRATLDARSEVLGFLFLAGTVIGLAVLAAGALHRAVVPEFLEPDRFPQEGVLLYGAFFTALLTLVYVPAHLALKRLSAKVRDHYFPVSRMPDPAADGFKSWLERRAALENLLHLHVSPAQQLEASLFIFAPLLSAVLTSLLPSPA